MEKKTRKHAQREVIQQRGIFLGFIQEKDNNNLVYV